MATTRSKYNTTGVTAVHKGRLLHQLSTYPLWCVIRPKGSRPTRLYFFERSCAKCGKRAFASIQYKAEHTFCSRACFHEFQKGENHPGWRGGFTHAAGHKLVRILRDGADRSEYVSEHRLVAEKMLGRKLTSTELVHHIDCDKHNNDPSNLDVLSQSQHSSAHQSVNGILRGLIKAGIVWFDRDKKIYRSRYGEVDLQSEVINRYQRNLRRSRRLAGNPIPRKKNHSISLSALIEREIKRKAA